MGLLDQFFGNADQTQALGLLGAHLMAGNAPGGFQAAQGLLADAPRRRMQEQLLQAQIGETQAQAQERAMKLQREQEALEIARRKQSALPGLFGGGGDAPGGAMPGEMQGAAQPGAQFGQFNVQAAIKAGFSPKEIMEYAALRNANQDEVARTIEGRDAQNRPITTQFDKFGRAVGAPIEQWKAPIMQNLGNRTAAIDPATLQERGSFAQGVDPGTVYSGNITMRGQNMTDSRARDLNAIQREGNTLKLREKQETADLTKNSQIASFDTMLGTLDRLAVHPGLKNTVGVRSVFPTMPGSESANFQAELNTFQSQAFLPMVAQLKGMGALSDAEGKKLTAAVGALDPKMGEKAFRESVARITADMEAARMRMSGKPREGGAGGGWSIQKVN